ncbi:hypothetical protein GOP47_0004391 [Adiantum capillus-veneris]|uniref:Uncharacterized protein n=1 Tax=Adiantum capillus-veneris TaxID=13818 RepID=A0A9D4V7T1_ADICA|nr:hypothetical protein GOP47_0004391 [Adiantum capillus-veneris]
MAQSQHVHDAHVSTMEVTAPAPPQHRPNSSTSCDAHATAACTYDAALTASSDPEDSSPFSIRGYVAAVREVDITRCWPFSQKLLEESIQAHKDPLLPPLTPLTCHVRIQREYYQARSHADMDTSWDVTSGPQLQVQIDVSKCEPGGVATLKQEERPSEGDFASQASQGPCSPHKEPAHKQDSPFPDSILAFKRQAPRSIREIRKSIMQGCDCFKRTDCTKDSCKNSHNFACMDSEGDAATVANPCTNLTNHLPTHENISIITELECHRKDADRGQDYIGVQGPHMDGIASTVDNLHAGAVGAAAQLNSPCDMAEFTTAAEKILLTSEASKDLPSHAILQSKVRTDCSLDSQSSGKSIESQNSKSLSSRPRCDQSLPMQEDTSESIPGVDNIPQQRCPVCLLFQCSSNTALNAHIDRCLVASSADVMDKCNVKLHRGKVRKKRSMAELCQVAPPCASGGKHPFPGASSVAASQNLKETSCTPTEYHKRKRTKLHPHTRLENASTDLIKSQAQALQFLHWRSIRSASSRRDLQMHGTTRRSALHEARLATFNTSRLRSRKLEMKACSVLRKKQWKRQKIEHEPAAVSKHAAQRLKKLMQTKKRKSAHELQNDVRQFLSTLPQTDLLKGVLHKDKPAASNPIMSRKRRPSKQTANVQTPDAVVTVKGSHKTTLEILRPNDSVNEELNQPQKIHFRVHVKPAKRQNKQRTSVDVPQSVQNRENITSVTNKDATDSHKQTLFSNNGKSSQAVGSAQTDLVTDSNNNGTNLRRIAKEGLMPEPCLPSLPSVMQVSQAEGQLPPVNPLLHREIPSTSYAVRLRTDNIPRCFTDIDDVPLLSRDRQHKGQRNSGEPATQSWQSLMAETRQAHMKDSRQAQASHLHSHAFPSRGASLQKRREFPFSLCADKLSQLPRDSGKTSFLTKSSEHTTSRRPPFQIRPEQVAKLAQMLSASNRRREFGARQDTSRPHTVRSEAEIQMSIQPETAKATRQLNQGSQVHAHQLIAQNVGGSQLETWQAQRAPQRLPAWMQAAIHEQRCSAMSSVDSPMNSASHSTIRNTTPCVTREISRPSPTLDMIGNPVLRLMGKTMILMPESHQNQADHTTSHFNGSTNYINFFQLQDSEEAGRKQQRNVDQVYNLGTQEGIASQDYRCDNGVQSWINSSTPELQDFFVQIPSSSSTAMFPLAHQQTSPHVDGRNIPALDGDAQWLHVTSSSVPSGTLQSMPTNWPSQKANTTFFQPQTNLFCQHDTMVPDPPLYDKEIFPWKQKHSNPYGTMNPVQNLTDLTPQYPQTVIKPPLPCWLSNINRAHQPATVIVLDEEEPLRTFDTSTPGALEDERILGSRTTSQQTQQNCWAQPSPTISDTCHLKYEKQKSKTFIPIIYTVGSHLGGSCCAPRTMGARFQMFAGDMEYRDVDQGGAALNRPRRKGSCLDEAGRKTMISSYTSQGGSPADRIRAGASSCSIAGAPQLGHALKHMPSVEATRAAAERMKSLPTRGGPTSVREILVSRKPSNSLQQEASPTPESQVPRMECSVNMNPAEVDCQDTGQFMSTPTLISSFQAKPAPKGGQECMDNSRTMNARSQAQGLSSSPISLAVDTNFNAAIPPLGPTPDTSLRRHHSVVVGSSRAKAPGKENTNASSTFNFSSNPSICEDLSTRAIINMPSTAIPLADGHTDDAGMVQECSSSRMQALKMAGKFKIMNGRVSIIRKDMQTNVEDRAGIDRQLGKFHSQVSTMDGHNSTEVVERAQGHNAVPDESRNVNCK